MGTCILVPAVFMALLTAVEAATMEPFTTAPIVPTRLLTKLLHAETGEIVIIMTFLNTYAYKKKEKFRKDILKVCANRFQRFPNIYI